MTPMPALPILVFTLVVFLAVAQDDGSGGGGGPEFSGGGGMPPDFGKPKACAPFRCSTGHSAVPKSRPKFESTGCNSMSSGMQMFAGSGDKNPEDDAIGPCCDRWHACYQICGSNKVVCDDAFKKCGEERCAKVPDPEVRKKCETTASINGMMLSLGDCRKYDEAQREACQCVPSDKVGGYRKDAIRGFYRKFVAKDGNVDDDKVKALAEKANTRAKMAGLLQKLVAKYPDSIKKVRDPQQAMYEEMLKNKDKLKEEKPWDKKDQEEEAESDTGEDDSDETQEL